MHFIYINCMSIKNIQRKKKEKEEEEGEDDEDSRGLGLTSHLLHKKCLV